MKRLSTVLLAGILILVLVAAVSGCGGDTKQAKEYTTEAESLAEDVQTSVNEIPTKFQDAFAGVTDPTQYAAAAKEVDAFLEDIKDDADKAIAQFEKVESLNGVADYKEYAGLWIQILELAKQTVDEMQTFISESTNLVNAGDTAGLETLKTSFDTKINGLVEEITSLEEEANKLKSDKDL
ncbi:MAG: hypothetical protein KKF41_13490 [Actinobacteria bacterium]|nr:hypothetical protein [Actinomycetota bacterium]MBU1943887.1 hypothetical protein [Actinomycetota bacterium]MBU2688591.1 hypothetical protein [Actinomycetota bacterium]